MIKCENACPRGKFDGCCHKCPDFHTCPDSCQEDPNTCGSSTFDEEAGLQAFQQSQLATLNAIASLTSHKKAIEEQEKTMKAALYDAMMKFGVKKFESDVLNLTLVAPSNSTTIDSAKLKKKYPAIAAECSKPNPKAGYVKELKAALVDVPDELEVRFGSDTEEAYEIIIEMARRVKYELPDGQKFEDTGETGVDYFEIYGNAVQSDDF